MVGAVGAVLLALTAGAGAEEPYVGQGLVPVRNFQPIQGLSLQMPVDDAMPLKPGELILNGNVSETSTTLLETSPTGSGTVKIGQMTSVLGVRYGSAMRDVEVGAQLVTFYRHNDALDGFIRDVEKFFGRPNGARDALENTNYVYSVRAGSFALNPPNNSFGVNSVVLHSKALLASETTYVPATSLRVALKVPIGDKDRAMGTGAADVGVGLSLQKNLSQRFNAYININEVLPTGHYQTLGQRGYFTSVNGVEFMATPKFSVTAQFDYYQSPFGNTGLKLLDHGVTEVVLAFGYRFLPELLWQIYGVENVDLIRDSAADFTIGTALTYRFPQK